jgi:SEC-C motif-containing protein
VIEGTQSASTAEQLMRCRYTAYATANVDFLKESMLPSTRSGFDAKTTQTWATESTWRGLEVVATDGGAAEDSEGVVEFVAHYSQKGHDFDHHEVATFRKEKGRWFFEDGKIIGPEPVRRTSPKIGRNDPCPCGSGKKYKKCCGRSDAAAAATD